MSWFAGDGPRSRHHQVGARYFADHDLCRYSGLKEKGNDAGGEHRAGASGPGRRVYSGRWNRGDRSTESEKIRSFFGALAALGPEDTSAKTEMKVALKRAKAQESVPARVDPGARMGAARDKVARLEQAIATTGNCQGRELDVLFAALKKAKKESQERPFGGPDPSPRRIHRKGIGQFDLERAAEV